MPVNFPEMWLNRVRTQLRSANVAPWLSGIEELDTAVIEMGSGTAGEKNLIHIPISFFDPTVLINNSTYPLALEEYTDDETVVALDKYQSLPTTLSDDQIIGASYQRIDNATGQHVNAINTKKYMKAIHALAPDANAEWTPVNFTKTDKFTFADLANLKLAFDNMEVPLIGRRIVLSNQHWNDLIMDESNKYYNKMLVDFRQGDLVPVIAGFEIYQYVSNPYFDVDGKKLPWGAVKDETDTQASVAYYVPYIVMKTGLTKQYFAPANLDPENQTNRLNYRHYFIVLPAMPRYYGAIVTQPE